MVEKPKNPNLERIKAIRSMRQERQAPKHSASFNTLIEYVTGDTGMRELNEKIAKDSLEKIKHAEQDELRALLFEREAVVQGILDAVETGGLQDKGEIRKSCEKKLGYIKLIRQAMGG